jgi:hypothetical protein
MKTTRLELAFVSPWISHALFIFVALLWLTPDPRIARTLAKHEKE